MSAALRRAAYSTNIKTRLDFSCSLLDGRARTIAQSFTQPIHLGTIARFVPNIVEAFGGPADLRPGDAIICNDSHLGGLHLNDVCLVAPLIVDGEPFAYAVSMAHHVDIGGGTPGSIGLWREQVQEGLIIPPVRLMREGVIDETFLRAAPLERPLAARERRRPEGPTGRRHDRPPTPRRADRAARRRARPGRHRGPARLHPPADGRGDRDRCRRARSSRSTTSTTTA